VSDVIEDRLMTTVEVSRLFRCSLQTVRRYEREGRLRSVRVGGLLRFKREDVQRLIDEGRNNGSAQA
jgi:excisionase family DNA binding protein